LAIKVEGTLEELLSLFGQGAKQEARKIAKEAGKKTVRKTVKRSKSAWQKFLKSFKFRKQRKSESNAVYFGARTKAAAKAYKRAKNKRNLKIKKR
tara:strand:+ start:2580 stop:2864 length:285 start_codon:yes stop_codon:yes gene_type:complete